jgi:UrcA family protein
MTPPPEDSVLTGVTVSVPRTIKRERYGVVSQVVNMSVRVPYGDLDLQTPAGAAELDKRVREAGNYVCRQLEVMYPVGSPDTFGCVKEAIGDAQPQVVLARAPN